MDTTTSVPASSSLAELMRLPIVMGRNSSTSTTQRSESTTNLYLRPSRQARYVRGRLRGPIMSRIESSLGASSETIENPTTLFTVPRNDSSLAGSRETIEKHTTLFTVPRNDSSPGASRETIEKHTTLFTVPRNECEAKECLICIEGMEPEELARMLPCSHSFHSPCIVKWLKINNTCPICRQEIC